MTDGLLQLYKDELRLLRQDGAFFATAHPDVASHLRIDHDGVSADPHVERLMEGFAYLTARVQRKISDEFPEITEALLGVLYPHLLAPIPSASIVQFTLAPDAAGPHVIPRGNVIETDPVDGHACTFRTTAAAALWPIRVESASVGPIEEKLPGYAIPPDAKSRLKIRLRAVSKDAPFSVLAALPKEALKSLRVHLHDGGGGVANLLYEFLINNICEGGIALSAPGADATRTLPDEGVSAAGFARDEAILPHDARTFPGYRLLMEYFAFPQKFLFIDIAGFNKDNMGAAADAIDMVIYFDRTSTELERGVTDKTLRLGCVPIVNLFAKTAEEIDFTHHDLSYRVAADSRRERATEIYSIDRVEVVSPGKPAVRYAPLYGLTHTGKRGEEGRYFHSVRRPSGDHEDFGTEVDLALIDLADGGRQQTENGLASGAVIRARVTCLNRDWPSRLKLGAGETRLHLHQAGPVERVESLVAQTPTLRPAQREAHHWRLISHLSLNHLAITGGEDGARALREILALYDFSSNDKTRSRIEAVRSIRSTRSPFRVDRGGSFCRGVRIEMDLDDKKFADHGAFLFASVLDRFLAMSCTVNSASRLVVKTSDRTWNRWPARAGERALV